MSSGKDKFNQGYICRRASGCLMIPPPGGAGEAAGNRDILRALLPFLADQDE